MGCILGVQFCPSMLLYSHAILKLQRLNSTPNVLRDLEREVWSQIYNSLIQKLSG